jgi:hydrogenase nickel incorporation protein HypB
MNVKVTMVRNILEANDRLAEDNRRLFERHRLKVINLMSAPGAGKTTLLERTVEKLRGELRMGVVEGDIQTSLDAERIERAGASAVQINTDGACHLDANMIAAAVGQLDLDKLDRLIVENVGNLVCPAEFKVGEHAKVMVLSLAEGDDKPLKYPLMFKESSVLLINKLDLALYVSASPERIEQAARSINPEITIFRVSCKTGEGLDAWYDWLRWLCVDKKTEV